MQLPFQIDLQGRVAVVTGGAGVLCSEFCRALAACGASVAIVNRTLEKGRALAAEITESGGVAEAFSADVTDAEAVAKLYTDVHVRFGACDILINGAGGNNPRAITDDEFYVPAASGQKDFFALDPAGFSYVFGVNLLGTLLPTQAFAKDMAARGSGSILNISSMSAFAPLTKVPAYSAAKAAVSNFTQWLAVYLAGSGVRVNAIAPGFFASEQNKTLLWNADGSPSARAQKILQSTPMRRFGEPAELIGALLWLLDERAAGFVTGIVLPVDGGFAAYSGV